ncbi:MAG: NUDIX domain-containing protein [Deltaproteobacteria bacterium]|jgi:ADP-ribose pyrophosphatase YjhB (NUDIX family)|nr:NUDIX domain-containing protein [Deltaproteobacteria bacterium]
MLKPCFRAQSHDGDDLSRSTCDHCGFIDYQNPRIVVGSVVEEDGKVLLCRRAIEPRRGLWTVPAGFLEQHETPEQGARREAREEAEVDLHIEGLLAIYTISHISQIQLMYRAVLATPGFAAGPESLEVELFEWDRIPWDQLAFPSVKRALEDYRRDLSGAPFTATFDQPLARLG